MEPLAPQQIPVEVYKVTFKQHGDYQLEMSWDGYGSCLNLEKCYRISDWFESKTRREFAEKLRDWLCAEPRWIAWHGRKWGARLQLDVWNDGWVTIWRAGNESFRSFDEEEKQMDAYCKFIEDEARKIADFIDEGRALEEIDALIDKGHSGNTYGMALHFGIQQAENKENADAVRMAHNAKHGVTSGDGTVNPAILKIQQ